MADPESSPNNQPPVRVATAEMIDATNRFLGDLRSRDPVLADHANALKTDSAEPLRSNQKDFPHLVAQMAQDVEKTLGHQLPLSEQTRLVMTQLAGTVPGLENERMTALLQSTSSINNSELVRDIRQTGVEISRQSDQNTDHIKGRVENLEHAVRQADRAPELLPPPATPNAGVTTTANASGPQQAEGKTGQPANNTENPRETTEPGARGESARTQEEAKARAAGQRDTARVEDRTPLDNIQGILRNVGSQRAASPWDAAPQPFADRLNAFQARMNEGRDHIGLEGAERAGRAALDAMEGFRTGDGATVMNRIASAARSDPEGMQGVMAGMRDGGRYQDLRQQFNGALHDEKGFAQAYDKAAEALAKYGEARVGVEQIISRRPDAANLTSKFQQLDAEIGEKAEGTPSRREGKNALEDISKQAAEIIQKAVEGVKSFFNKAGPENTSRPSPSPS
jgi:hypothetical protein